MGLESGTYISDLVVTNPTGSDQRYTADDHIRLIKTVLKNTFPNVDGAVTVDEAILNSVFAGTSYKTGTFNVTKADHGRLFLLDANSGAFTVTFDAAASLGNGFKVSFMKVDATANALTLNPNGAEQINEASTLAISDRWERVDVTCTGTVLFASTAQSVAAHEGDSDPHPQYATDTDLSTHAGLTAPHSATTTATANRLMLRNGAGQAQVAAPSAAADVANKGYVDGSKSMGGNGWVELPGGLILQWGTVGVSGNTNVAVGLPRSFPNAGVWGVVGYNGNTEISYTASVMALTTSQITVRSAGGNSKTLNWFALGY